MKNIERTEVQKKIASTLGDCGTCHLCPFTVDEKICRDHKEWPCSKTIYEWFQQEYFEPHHWEPWELEAMRNIPKRIVYLERRHDELLPRALQKEDCYSDHGICTQINFPSLKNEKIDIDAELERNGMHR